MRAQRINSAIVTCLEHVATSTAPPGVGAADFLLRLLDDGVFNLEEVDEITRRVTIILRGITERHEMTLPSIASCPERGDLNRNRVTRPIADFQSANAELRKSVGG